MTTETTKPNDGPTSTESVPGGDYVDRLVRLFTWLCLNGALVWCAWEGVVSGNVGAGRVLAFAAWFFAVIYWLAAIAPKEVTAKAVAKGRSVPAWVSHGFDAAMIVFLVWHGWWWTAVAFVLLTIAEAGIYHKPNDQEHLQREEKA
jgi:hypothetical protein